MSEVKINVILVGNNEHSSEDEVKEDIKTYIKHFNGNCVSTNFTHIKMYMVGMDKGLNNEQQV